MRKLVSLFTMILLLCGCGNDHAPSKSLLAVESTVEKDAYHAFIVLDSLERQGLSSDADSALFNLLYLEALHQVGLISKADSDIFYSEKYYERMGDKQRLTRSYLHHGISLAKDYRYSEGIEYLKKAERLASSLSDDKALNYDVQTALGFANSAADCHELAIRHYDAARRLLDLPEQNEQYAECLMHIGQAYRQLDQLDSFMVYLSQSIPLLSEKEHKAEALTELADYYYQKGDTATAWHLARKSELSGYDYMPARILGDIMRKAGKEQKAIDYYYQAVNSSDRNTRIYAYRQLISHFNDNHDMKSALSYSQRLNEEFVRYRPADSREIAEYQAEFDKQWQAEQIRHTLFIVGMAVIMAVALILVVLFLQRRRNQRLMTRIARLNGEYSDYLQRYRQLKEQMQSEQNVAQSLLERRQREIDELQQKLSCFQEDKAKPQSWNDEEMLNDDIVFHLHGLAARGRKVEAHDWQALNELFQEKLPHFLPAINQSSDLSQREQQVCELIRLRFIPSEIAVLLTTTTQAVTNIRSRLLQKIFGVKGGAKDFDQRIRQL